jgi:MFS family permease
MPLYETFISMAAVSGLLIGRLLGSFYVNYGRFRCIILGAIIQCVGIGICLIFGIYFFLFGRLIYSIGSGIFFSSSFRYVEECSPPNLLSMLFTIYSFGISLGRPTVTLMSFLTLSGINEETDKEILLTTNAWRYFIMIPMSFCIIFILGMIFIIKNDTPMFLITQKRYDEAKRSISHFTGKHENHAEIFTYLKLCSSKDTNSASWKEALCHKKYRKTSYLSLILNLSTLPNGVHLITSFGGIVFPLMYE